MGRARSKIAARKIAALLLPVQVGVSGPRGNVKERGSAGFSMLCEAWPQVSSRMEIGLLKMKGGEEGGGAGALMLPEVFVQKVKQRHIDGTVMSAFKIYST